MKTISAVFAAMFLAACGGIDGNQDVSEPCGSDDPAAQDVATADAGIPAADTGAAFAADASTAVQPRPTEPGGQLLVAKSSAFTDDTAALGSARFPMYGVRLCASERDVEVTYLKLALAPVNGGQVITDRDVRYFTDFVVTDGAVVVMGPAELDVGVYVAPEGWPTWFARFQDPFIVAAGSCREIAFRGDLAYAESYPGDIVGKKYLAYLSQIETNGSVSFAGDVGPAPSFFTVVQ